MPLNGHFWTIAARLGRGRGGDDVDQEWTTTVVDPRWGEVRLTGRLAASGGADTVVVVVHGLGGSSGSGSVRAARDAAVAAGLACLRLDLRGADGSGEDLYHAGLTADLAGAVASPALLGFSRVLVLGFSVGGHVALRWAAGTPLDRRVAAVAAVCPPLDLEACQRTLDRPGGWLYRRYLLAHLRRAARPLAARGRLPVAWARLARVRSIREWDACTVVPRFGFADPDDYYAQTSVAGRVAALRVPTLIVAARHDPVVPASSFAGVERADLATTVSMRWLDRGGHLGFPASARLGEAGPSGVEAQCVAWLARQAVRGRSPAGEIAATAGSS